MGKPIVERTGARFGGVVIVGRAPSYRGNARWCFKCDCGLYSIALGNDLQRGKIKSCGCENRGTRFLTHGLSQTPEYRVWQGMNQRCHNPKSPSYARYGGRGILVCERWRIFTNFFADMGRRPGTGFSLERVNNDLGYQPDNCQWVRITVQANNTRRNRPLTYNDRTQTLAQWAQEYGMGWYTLRSRLDHYGWPLEKALTTPAVRGRNNSKTRLITFQGHTKSLSAWAKEIGLAPRALRNRLVKDWPLDRALTEPRRW